jgi:hypothetical protein
MCTTLVKLAQYVSVFETSAHNLTPKTCVKFYVNHLQCSVSIYKMSEGDPLSTIPPQLEAFE